MKILAIDPAQRTGFCLDVNSGKFGFKDFKLKRDESFGFKLLQFKKFLKDLIETEGVELVAFERPSGHHAAAVQSHSKFIAMIEEYCAEHGIPTKGFSAKEIKSHATGNGNANKVMMIAAANKKFNQGVEDDNVADAIWIWDLAQSEAV